MTEHCKPRSQRCKVRKQEEDSEAQGTPPLMCLRTLGTNRGPGIIQEAATHCSSPFSLAEHPAPLKAGAQAPPQLPSRSPSAALRHGLCGGCCGLLSQVRLSVARCLSSKLCSRGSGEEVISPTVGRRQRWMGRQLCASAKQRRGSELHQVTAQLGGHCTGTSSPLPNTQQPGKLFYTQMAPSAMAASSPLLSTPEAGRQQPLFNRLTRETEERTIISLAGFCAEHVPTQPGSAETAFGRGKGLRPDLGDRQLG